MPQSTFLVLFVVTAIALIWMHVTIHRMLQAASPQITKNIEASTTQPNRSRSAPHRWTGRFTDMATPQTPAAPARAAAPTGSTAGTPRTRSTGTPAVRGRPCGSPRSTLSSPSRPGSSCPHSLRSSTPSASASKGQLVPAGGHPRSGRRQPPTDLDLLAAAHGHPQARHHHLRPARHAGDRLGTCLQTPHSVRRPDLSGRSRRDRWRSLLRLHALHVLLLPEVQAGHRVGPSGRYRQLRGEPLRPVRHSVDRGAVDHRCISALRRHQEGHRQGGLVPERRLHLGAVHHRRHRSGLDPAPQRPGARPRRARPASTSSPTSTPGS